MEKCKTINYRDCEIIYSVFGKSKRFSATAKIILPSDKEQIIKSIVLNNKYATAIHAEEKILQISFAKLRNFYEKNTAINH